ncbi:hypothetical protein WSM22_47410 [Cytophagales bacterium WSM2-2]|nr:hypothetical protein WSM22_47410 [Cytophagales bacterium WSM2-2]
MKIIEHPSHVLNHLTVDVIRQAAAEAESMRRLHPDQLEMIYKQRWLNMYVPKKSGGLELSLPEILRIEESLAWADGSTAWLVTLCSGAAWFIGFLDPRLAKEVFADEKVCFAGSGAATGTAEVTADGYLINGAWRYASGSLQATVFTANCLIRENGKQLYNEDGSPVIQPFLMKRNEVKVLETWNSMGMIATGSHSFEVKNLKLSKQRIFKIDGNAVVIDNPVFRFPFLQLAETTLAVNLSGLALRFHDLSKEIILRKMTNVSQRSMKHVHRMGTKINDSRDEFYRAVNVSWNSCRKKKNIPKAELNKVSKASHALVKQSRILVDTLYPHCGLIAADTRQEINRVWRNFHTATQHSLFRA